MSEEKLLTVRDVSLILGISEKEVIDLAESARIPAYKVGGVYLRFKRAQIEEFRKSFKPLPAYTATSSKDARLAEGPTTQEYSFKDRISDFFYFNDFYILSILIIMLMLFIILK